jgi:hypothetical protein
MVMKAIVAATLAAMASGCTVLSVAGTAVATTVSVAGTVVSTGVSVAGSAIKGVAGAVSGSGSSDTSE